MNNNEVIRSKLLIARHLTGDPEPKYPAFEQKMKPNRKNEFIWRIQDNANMRFISNKCSKVKRRLLLSTLHRLTQLRFCIRTPVATIEADKD